MTVHRGLRVAALVKQVPATDRLRLDESGLLLRGTDHEMNAFCRRAVMQAVLLADKPGGHSVAFTMGPPSAFAVLAESVACGIHRAAHLCDRDLIGSDTLVTARALAASIEREGPFDIVLAGRGSADSDTGSVGPQVAELLGLPFAGPARSLRLVEECRAVELELELDGASDRVRVELPAVVTTAERLCKAAGAPRDLWPTNFAVTRYRARDLGPGPWGLDGSRTRVGSSRPIGRDRAGVVLRGSVPEQVECATDILVEHGAFAETERRPERVPVHRDEGPPVVALVGSACDTEARALVGGAVRLAGEIGGHVVAVGGGAGDVRALGTWGADVVLRAPHYGASPLADAVHRWALQAKPWAILATAHPWGREVVGRLAVRLDAGLVADALGFVIRDGRLLGEKAAFGGHLAVEIHCTSAVQCATVRPGVFPLLAPQVRRPRVEALDVGPERRITRIARRLDDLPDSLGRAQVVVGVGLGVRPKDYPLVDPLLQAVHGELGATRKVTDRGWLPHSRQIGSTGRAVAPQLYVALGISGDPQHLAGLRGAGSLLAVNLDPRAPIFHEADLGIVADWREVVPLLVAELESRGLAAGRRVVRERVMPAPA